ncbi:MAG TPA: hypothetical protein VMN57_04495 [Anaerolineales bacterium]|nr:hypothetical protein [Anaerolineales bacterium]
MRDVRLLHHFAKGPKPGDSSLGWHAGVRSLIDRRELAAKLGDPGQVGSVGNITRRVLKSEVALLALDPRTIDRYGALGRSWDDDKWVKVWGTIADGHSDHRDAAELE